MIFKIERIWSGDQYSGNKYKNPTIIETRWNIKNSYPNVSNKKKYNYPKYLLYFLAFLKYLMYKGHSINKGNYFEKYRINFVSKNFHKCKLYIVWNWFIVKIILIVQKYFSGYLKWWQIKQSATDLNRGLTSEFWWLKSANHMKCTQECVMCRLKHVWVKEMSANPKSTKTVHEVEIHWLFEEENIPRLAISQF